MVPSSYYKWFLKRYQFLTLFLRLPSEIMDAFNDLNNDLLDDLPFIIRKQRMSSLGKLKTILSMSCFGYNSSK